MRFVVFLGKGVQLESRCHGVNVEGLGWNDTRAPLADHSRCALPRSEEKSYSEL